MKLIIQQGKDAGRQIRLERGLVTIGRGRECDVVLHDTQASRRHVELRRHGDRWLLIDLGSTNGTFVGGVRQPAQEPRPLGPGTPVSIGDTRFVLVDEPEGTSAELPYPAPEAAPRTASRAWGMAVWLARLAVAVGSALLILGSLSDWIRVQVDLPLVGRVMDRTFDGKDSGLTWLFIGAAGLALGLMMFDVALRRWGLAAGLGQALAGALAAIAAVLSFYQYYQLGTQRIFGVSLIDVLTRYARDSVTLSVQSGIRLLAAGLAAVVLGGLVRLLIAGLEPGE